MNAGSLSTAGAFRLLQRLDAGSQGSVWEAIHVSTREAVAIKMAAEGEQEALFKEARLLACCESPHVVEVLDYGILSTGEAWMAMTRANAGTLAMGPLRDGLLDWADIGRMLGQLLDALSHLHGRRILHLDLCAENVLAHLDHDGSARWILGDLGVAGREGGLLGAGAGHIGSMAPECFDPGWGQPCAATDLYALGVLALEVIRGTHPVQTRSRDEAAILHRRGLPVGPMAPYRVPAAVRSWLQRLLSPIISERYPDAISARSDLARLVSLPPPSPLRLPSPLASPQLMVHRSPDARARVPVLVAMQQALTEVESRGVARTLYLQAPARAGRTAILRSFARWCRQRSLPVLRLDLRRGSARAWAVATLELLGVPTADPSQVAVLLRRALAPLGAAVERLDEMMVNILCGELELSAERSPGGDAAGETGLPTMDPAAIDGLLLRLLEARAGSRPLVVLLDGGVADALTSRRLESLRSRAPGMLVASVASLPGMDETVVEIDTLAEATVEEILHAWLRLDPSSASLLARRSMGLPGRAVELLFRLGQLRALLPGARGWKARRATIEALAEGRPPEAGGIIDRLLQRLGPEQQKALVLAFLLRRHAGEPTWSRACSRAGIHLDPVEREELLQEGLFRSSSGQEESLVEVEDEIIRLWSQSALHAAAAEALELDGGAGPLDLARLWTRAGQVGPAALRFLQAADAALNRSEYELAAEALSELRGCLAEAGIGEDDLWHGQLRLREIRVAFSTGRHVEASAAAVHLLDQALARGWVELRCRALRLRGMLALRSAQKDRWASLAFTELAAAEAREAALPLEEARARMHAATALRGLNRLEEAARAAALALRLAEQPGARDVEPEINHLVADCNTLVADLAAAREAWDEAGRRYRTAIEIFSRIGNAFGEARCLNGLGEVARQSGDPVEAERCYQRACQIFTLLGSPDRVVPVANLGLLQVALGRPDRARPHLLAALALEPEPVYRTYIHLALLATDAAQKEWPSLSAHLLRARELLPQNPVEPDGIPPVELAATLACEGRRADLGRELWTLAGELWQNCRRIDAASRCLANARAC